MAYLFGKDFTFQFYPIDDEGDVVSPSADAPSIYVYSERPSRQTVRNEDGSSADVVGSEITSWSNSGNAYQISIPAISDPDADGTISTRTYYLAAAYTLKSSGQEQISIVPFEVSRAIGYDNELSVSAASLEKYFPQIDSYTSEAQQSAFVTEAIEEIKAELRDAGYEYARITRPERLRIVVIHRTLMRIALSQIARGDIGFETLYQESKLTQQSMLASLRLEYDASGDGEEDKEVSKKSFLRVVR